MSISFNNDEIEALRSHGIVIFAERIIFEAQPPMSIESIAAIESKCSGKIPPALSALWSQTAGGRMAYDLKVEMSAREEPIGWTELFYNGSNAYHDLNGWIEHERMLCQESAEENGTEWNGKLDFLPFGGFEYCDRIYVFLGPGADYGKIIAWKQGYPPAWTDCLTEDSVVGFANDLYEAFAVLYVEEDPRNPNARYAMGKELIGYLDDRVNEGLSRELSDKVLAYFCQAMIDWKTSLENGTISRRPVVSKAALRHAISQNDGVLIRTLASAGVAMDKILDGRANAIDLAVKTAKFEAVDALVEVGAPVSADIFRHVNDAIPVGTTQILLKKGALAEADLIVKCVACGAPESARLMAAASSSQKGLKKSFEKSKAEMLKSLENDLKRVRKREIGHYLGESGLAARIANLKSFGELV